MFNNNRLSKYFVAWMIFCVLTGLAGLGLVGWVAIHFISKVW